MGGPYLIAIDQSTSSTKALLFNRAGDMIGKAGREHRQKISAEGWISHDGEELYQNTLAAVRDLVQKTGVLKEELAGAGISNQRETAILWDLASGKPLNDAVVWQCNRGKEICDALIPYAEDIRRRSGLPLSPYFSAAKIAWLLRHTEHRASKKLRAGTIDSWLLYKLTGNCGTDVSNASRTQLLNLHGRRWDEQLCGYFGIDPALLPELRDSDSCFGYTDFEGFLPSPIPIHAIMGDSQAALFAQGCRKKGMAKATYGTGSSVMVNTGEEMVLCENVVTSLAWSANGTANYVVEGNINYSGAVITWLVNDVKLIGSAQEAEELAAAANPADTTYLVPAFSGLGCPHWIPGARAVLCGMSRVTGRGEIVRAAEESIAWQIHDIVACIQAEAGIALGELRADGGASRDSFLMQFQSDILNLPLIVPANEECSGSGAAWMAGIALGIYDEMTLVHPPRIVYRPAMADSERSRRLLGWEEALRLVTGNRRH
jgi:glycerol kinase